MGIDWNNRVIADTRLASVHGARMAGGYLLHLGVEFDVLHWDQPGSTPQVLLSSARVYLQGQSGLALGHAIPQSIRPFTVTQYYGRRQAVQFELTLSQQAMETVERHRNGADIALLVKLQAEVRRGEEVAVSYADVQNTFSVPQWLLALDQAGFGRSLLFEVPIPAESEALGSSLEMLEAARHLLTQGHYADVVAKCRMVIEAVTTELGQSNALMTALQLSKQNRALEQRELVMRQAAMDFASLAHHPTGVSLTELFDRNAAQMMLGTTAALVSSAMARQAAGQRQP